MHSVEKFYTWEANKRVELRKCIGPNEIHPLTIPFIFKEAAIQYGKKSALVFMDNGQQKKVSFIEYYHQVRTVAKAFLKLGLQRYHSVCILGANSAPWIYANLAAIMAGGIACGIYASNSPEACLHCLRISDANIIIVENDDQLQKILKIQNQATKLKAIVQIRGTPTHDSVLTWEKLIEMGSKESDDSLNEIIETLVPNECSSILFTSGTTGPPKAIMLSHDNLIFKTKSSEISLQMNNNNNRRVLSYLPLSHIAAQVFDVYKGIVAGVCIYIADDRALKDTIVDNLRTARPTEFLAVPRIWEKIKEHIDIYMRTSQSINQYYYRISDNHLSSRDYDDQLCSKIKEIIGLNECKIFQTGAAPSSSDLKLFFSRFDIPLSEVFGMTETSGSFISATGLPTELAIDSCGQPSPTVKVKIHQPDTNNIGELCVYGRQVFMGYLKDPQSTKAAFDYDGYFRTGDLAYCRENLYTIAGRIKEILITSGGENVSPILIEFEIKKELPIVSHAVVVGDRKKYLSLLITLKTNRNSETDLPTSELSSDSKWWYKYLGCDYQQVSEILQHQPTEVYQAIQAAINRVNAKAISSAQRIQKFIILPTDFSTATGELSSTTKLLRNVIYKKYKSEIDMMYTS